MCIWMQFYITHAKKLELHKYSYMEHNDQIDDNQI